MNGAGSRRKGKTAEREFERDLLIPRGWDYSREQDGREQTNDFRFQGFWNEVKRRERLEVEKWCREVEARVPDHACPLVTFRRNGQPWRSTLLTTDLFDLIEEARS